MKVKGLQKNKIISIIGSEKKTCKSCDSRNACSCSCWKTKFNSFDVAEDAWRSWFKLGFLEPFTQTKIYQRDGAPLLQRMESTEQCTIKPISLQFREQGVVGACAKDFTEAQTNDSHSPSLVHCCRHSTVEGHWVGLAGLALCEAVLSVSNHLHILKMP